MNLKKLRKIRAECDAARQGQRNARDLEAIAVKLGRAQANRGKEPVWESTEFPLLVPLSIPHHGGSDIPIGTKNSIISVLENDIEAWEERLSGDEDNEDG